MIETVRKLAGLVVGPGQRSRWLLVVAMAVAVSLAEAVATLLVFALLGVLTGDTSELSLPLIGDVRPYLPWQGSDLLAALGAATAVIFVGRSALILLQHYVQFRVAENAGAALSTRLFDGYLAMPYSFHLQRNSSELVRNAFDSVRRLVAEGLVPTVQLFGKAAMVVGVGAVLLAASPIAMAFALAALGPLTWLILRVVHPRVKRFGRTAQSMTKANLQTLQQSLHGVRDIVVLGRESTFVEAYRRDRYDLARARYLRATAAQVPRVGIETGVLILIAVFVGLAAFTQDSIAQTLPLLGLFGYAAARLMPELQHITQGLNALKFVGPAVDDVDADFQVFARERRNDGAPVEPLRFSQALTFTGVSYRYPGADHDALSDVDLKVRPGQSLGLVGPTGGGKSTLVDVLLGLLEPTKGQVCVDSISVHAHPRAWQANLGVVPQTVFLADDTIRSNIALGVPEDEVNTEALREAVSMAQLDEFVSSLPNGLNTVVGERGVRVSGGQRQRLAIARALYRRPSVLVFDEGTSALDNDTELALMDALARLRGQCTLITVAHRLSTVDECDTVLLMRGGCIADRGRLVDLAARHLELQTASTVSDGS